MSLGLDRAVPRWTVGAVVALSAVAALAVVVWRRTQASVPPSSVPVAAASSSATPTSAPANAATGEVLVWAGQASDDPHEQSFDTVRTWWLTTDGGGSRVVADVPGVVLVHDHHAWRWTPTEKEIAPCVCGGAPVAGKGASLGAELVNIDSDERRTVLAPPDFCNSDGPASSVTLLGTVGSLLFVRSDHTEYGCGAHGISVPQFVVWDMATSAPVDLLHAIDVTTARTRALQQLGTAPAGSVAGPVPEPPDLELVTLQPGFAADGSLVLQGGFKTFACHACTGATSFVWGQYSRGVLVAVDTLPGALLPYAHAPEAVRWFVGAFPDRVVGGWSAPATGESLPERLRVELEKARR